MTVNLCASRIGVTPNNMRRLVNGHIGISPKVALGLEGLGWSNAEFWLRLQAQYDLGQLRLGPTKMVDVDQAGPHRVVPKASSELSEQ